MIYDNYSKKIKREISEENISNPSFEKLEGYFLSGNYDVYLVEFIGDLSGRLATLDYAAAFITQRFFAIVFVRKGMFNQLLKDVPEITNIEPNYVYTLSEISLDGNLNSKFIDNGNMSLDGEGVIVGIIGTGIDYLNPRFQTPEGESRIIAIWDQVEQAGPGPEFFNSGTEYNKASIDAVISSKVPNDLLNKFAPPRDNLAVGTAIAGIIGGRKLNNVEVFEGIAPKCEFVIVNLVPAKDEVFQALGIEKGSKNIYQTVEIAAAIQYLSNVQETQKKPMVVYLPLGSNSGGRSGDTILERYIDLITQRRDFCIVTNTGNQGRGETHAGGRINTTGDTKEAFINVGESQGSLYVSIYTRTTDVIYTSITTPTGESISRIPIQEKMQLLYYEEEGISIEYIVQEKPGGNTNLSITIRNAQEGIWKISLYGQDIFNGIYDIWMLPTELLKPGTRFLDPNPNTTLLTPGTAVNIITTSYYDNLNNTIALNSGRGYPRAGEIQPAVTNEGFNILTVGENTSLVNSSGAAMAGAILAGAVALIYQWGIVQGNYTELYPQFIRNVLVGSTLKEENVTYPNEEWGYGKLSFESLGKILQSESRNTHSDTNNNYRKNESTSYLYINIPSEIYYRIKKLL